jgi:pimeloyl-ACP methyl ester carboxylesterase
MMALGFAERVVSLVLISTSPATSGARRLPPPVEEFGQFLATAKVDWTERESVIDYQVAYTRMLAGGQRPFDQAGIRELVRHDVERARNFSAARNHEVLPEGEQPRAPLSSIAVPTLVIHGTADPMFPVEHGEALADEIPGARMLKLAKAGHGIVRADWEPIVRAIRQHLDEAAKPAGPPRLP